MGIYSSIIDPILERTHKVEQAQLDRDAAFKKIHISAEEERKTNESRGEQERLNIAARGAESREDLIMKQALEDRSKVITKPWLRYGLHVLSGSNRTPGKLPEHYAFDSAKQWLEKNGLRLDLDPKKQEQIIKSEYHGFLE